MKVYRGVRSESLLPAACQCYCKCRYGLHCIAIFQLLSLSGRSHFLWVPDLSSFDTFIRLPFEIPFMGSHLGLFTILWWCQHLSIPITVPKMWICRANPAMKICPIFYASDIFRFFNSYAIGLTCYMFFSNLINIIQTIVTRKFIFLMKKNQEELDLQKNKPKKKEVFKPDWKKAMKQQQNWLKSRQNLKITQLKPAGVMRAGSFGITVANLLAENTDVLLFSRKEQVVHQINNTHQQLGYAMSHRVTATTDLKLICGSCDVIFSCGSFWRHEVNSANHEPLFKAHIIIHGTKGLDTSLIKDEDLEQGHFDIKQVLPWWSHSSGINRLAHWMHGRVQIWLKKSCKVFRCFCYNFGISMK